MKYLKKIGYTTATLIIGAVATLAIQTWSDRPKLFVAVEEVGFIGSEDYVEVGTRLRELSEDDPWFGTLERFVKWSALNDRYESILMTKGRLEVAIGAVEEWRERENRDSTDGQFPSEELANHPYARDATSSLFRTVVRAAIRRRELGIPPVGLSQVSAHDIVAEYTRDSQKWIVYGDTWLVVFSSSGMISEDQLLQGELVVKSLAHGNRENLVYYADRFLEIASKDVRHLRKIEDALVDVLYPQTRLFARVTVFNSGKNPAVLEPYAVLLILNAGFDINGTLMRATPGLPAIQDRLILVMQEYKDILDSITPDESDELSRQVEVVPLLPLKGRVQYVMVPPQGQAVIELVADEPLSDLGKRLREIYGLNLLELKVAFSLLDGGTVSSAKLVFSSSATDSLKIKLLANSGN